MVRFFRCFEIVSFARQTPAWQVSPVGQPHRRQSYCGGLAPLHTYGLARPHLPEAMPEQSRVHGAAVARASSSLGPGSLCEEQATGAIVASASARSPADRIGVALAQGRALSRRRAAARLGPQSFTP